MTRRRWALPALGLLLGATAVLCVSLGALRVPPLCILGRALRPFGVSFGCTDVAWIDAILALRLPRLLLGIAVGSGLGLAGATMQGIFRNPLVDPGLIGVSSGAALAASTMMVLGGRQANTPLILTVAAFAGGLAAATLVQRLSRVNGQTRVLSLLLAGIAVNAICGALLGLLSYIATDAQLRNLTFWTLGSLGSATFDRVSWLLPLTAVATISLLRLARPLNVLMLGEAEAEHLGISVESIKRRALLLSILLAASAVALCGIIGFIGLVVPHLLRLLIGADHRFVLPGAAMLGAVLILWADLLSRVIVAPAELPLGILTASIGGPFFLALLMREHRRWAS